MTTYTCPLCKSTFKRYKWFVKHINRYSEEERKKIFVKEDKVYYQGKLFKFLGENED